jgi:hypothetical protein
MSNLPAHSIESINTFGSSALAVWVSVWVDTTAGLFTAPFILIRPTKKAKTYGTLAPPVFAFPVADVYGYVASCCLQAARRFLEEILHIEGQMGKQKK